VIAAGDRLRSGVIVSGQESVTVVIGRFDPLTLLGLDGALRGESWIRVLASDLRGSALEGVVKRDAPNVVFLDERVSHSLLARLKARRPAPAVLVLARDLPELSRTTLIEAGVTCVAHSSSIEQLIAAVHRATQDTLPSVGCNPEARRDLGARLDLLTGREVDVLRMLSRGASYAEIAGELSMSESTAKGHFAHIKRKLGVANKREVIGLEVPYDTPSKTDGREGSTSGR
jgi:DNA-binding NarL/FixJ family response regulator